MKERRIKPTTPLMAKQINLSDNKIRAIVWVHYLLIALLLVIISLSLVNILWPHLLWHHFEVVHYPLHSTMEALGAIAAILIAFMPLQVLFGKYRPSYIFLSAGFLVMGLLDLLHSFYKMGNGFVFTHAIALLAGGFFFALFVFPWKINADKTKTRLLLFAAVITVLLGLLISLKRELFPEMVRNGVFTPMANNINLVAGLFFLISAVKLIAIYIQEKNLGLLILVFTAVSSAIAGFTFQYSEAWADSWWLWHIIRLIAFLTVLGYNFGRIQTISKERNEALRNIKENNELLMESEEKFRNLFNSVSIPLCHVREDGRIDDINNRFKKHLGYTLEDIPTINDWWEKAYPDKKYREWAIKNWDEAVQYSIENDTDIKSDVYQVSCKNGEVRQIIIAGITFGRDFLATFIDVTEQRKAEEAIIREKEYSETVINALPGIFYLFNEQGKYLKWNNMLEDLSGFTAEEIAERSPLDYFADYHKEKIAGAVASAFKEGETTVEGDFMVDGQIPTPFYFTGRIIEMEGKPHLLGVGLDISQRKKVEKEKEKALHDLNERMKEITCLFQVNEIIKNPKVNIPGVMKEITSLIPKGWHYPEKTKVKIVLDDEIYQSKEYKDSKYYLLENILVNDRERGYIKVTVFDPDSQQSKIPFINEEKELLRTIAGNISIYVHSVEKELAIRESEEKFRNVYSNSPVSLWEEDWTEIMEMIDKLKKEGVKDYKKYFNENRQFVNEALTKVVINDVNQATLKMFEAESKDELVKSLEVVFATEDTLPGFIDELAALAEGKRVYETEMKLNTVKGNLINTILRMAFPSQEINDRKVLVSIMDITELSKAQERLKVSMENLQHSNKELEQFAYVASHDLQEPLRMVSSYTQLLERRYKDKLDERADKYIYYAVDGAKRMQNLINDLLDFSRISTRGDKFAITDINEVVKNALKNLEARIDETGARINTGKLPLIKADYGQIERLFMNLVGNALKFSKPDEKPFIEIDASEQKNNWLFRVKDNGIGIDEKFKEKVFVIFQRLHGTTQYKGTGIGLAICKRIVKRHQGEIWFESEENKGATFYFTLKKHTL